MLQPAPATEDEMYVEIFKYIDRIFGMVRPRKVLFMAIGAPSFSASASLFPLLNTFFSSQMASHRAPR